MYGAHSIGRVLVSVQTAVPQVAHSPRRPVVVTLHDLAAPPSAALEAAPAQWDAVDGEASERVVATAGRWVGLLGSATFAGWTSLTCFVC